MTHKRGSTKRNILTAAAIFQMLAAASSSALADKPPEAEERAIDRRKSALEILRSMDESGTLLHAGRQAWIPGGYLGPSKNWG